MSETKLYDRLIVALEKIVELTRANGKLEIKNDQLRYERDYYLRLAKAADVDVNLPLFGEDGKCYRNLGKECLVCAHFVSDPLQPSDAASPSGGGG